MNMVLLFFEVGRYCRCWVIVNKSCVLLEIVYFYDSQLGLEIVYVDLIWRQCCYLVNLVIWVNLLNIEVSGDSKLIK